MRTTLGSVALGMIVRDFVSAEPIGPVKIYAQNCLQAPAE